MLKEIVFITLLLGADCFAMSPDDQFLDFIGKNQTDITMLRAKIQEKAQDSLCPFKDVAKDFLVKYSDCFDAKIVMDASTGYSASIFHSAAQLIGIGYLKDGMEKSQVLSLKIAIAWFHSVPTLFSQIKSSSTGSDLCIFDYKQISEREFNRITEQNEKLRQLRLQAEGVF